MTPAKLVAGAAIAAAVGVALSRGAEVAEERGVERTTVVAVLLVGAIVAALVVAR